MVSDGILSQILVKGFSGLLSNLASSYISRKDRSIRSSEDLIKRDLESHLEATFKKCMNVKTILNPESVSRTLEIYVDQTFRIRGAESDQYSLIESIRSGDSVLIIGEGGGGKSMFMRYLWLSYFEKSDGKIPFFLELRNLNSLTHPSISDFIFHSIIKSGSSIRQQDFENALREGEFILFLDGFDEINYDRRENIQSMILELRESNPKLTIVVTSRSDERFLGWENFIQAYVQPLKSGPARLLIERADYDADLKQKFLKKFDELFKQHEDFLSNPLLAYMMLVTFSFNPDIPRRMFQFYEQAFDALYHRHDLTKGYKRKHHCNLDKYDFIRLTSFLCLKTYYDENVEFSKIDLLSAIEKVKEIEQIKISSESFLNDLVQSVCIMKLEGLTYTFTHRSFQEYFAAYCISRVASRNIDQLFAKFSRRYSDKVLQMVSDINPELFRERFLVPNRLKFSSFFDLQDQDRLIDEFAHQVGASFSVDSFGKQSRRTTKSKASTRRRNTTQGLHGYHVLLHTMGPMADFYQATNSVAASSSYAGDLKSQTTDKDFVEKARALLGTDHFNLRIDWVKGSIRFRLMNQKKSEVLSDELSNALEAIFRDAMMNDFLARRGKLLYDYVNGEVAKFDTVSGTFDSLF